MAAPGAAFGDQQRLPLPRPPRGRRPAWPSPQDDGDGELGEDEDDDAPEPPQPQQQDRFVVPRGAQPRFGQRGDAGFGGQPRRAQDAGFARSPEGYGFAGPPLQNNFFPQQQGQAPRPPRQQQQQTQLGFLQNLLGQPQPRQPRGAPGPQQQQPMFQMQQQQQQQQRYGQQPMFQMQQQQQRVGAPRGSLPAPGGAGASAANSANALLKALMTPPKDVPQPGYLRRLPAQPIVIAGPKGGGSPIDNLKYVLANDSANKRVAFKAVYDRIAVLMYTSIRINKTLLAMTELMIESMKRLDPKAVARNFEDIMSIMKQVPSSGRGPAAVLEQLQKQNVEFLRRMENNNKKALADVERELQNVFQSQEREQKERTAANSI